MCVSLAQFTGSLSFGHALKDFFLLCKLVMKEIFAVKVMTSQTAQGPRTLTGSLWLYRTKCVNFQSACGVLALYCDNNS